MILNTVDSDPNNRVYCHSSISEQHQLLLYNKQRRRELRCWVDIAGSQGHFGYSLDVIGNE